MDWTPEWSADGRHLYFASDRGGAMGLWRVAIDEASDTPLGEPEYIAAGGDAWFDSPRVSRDGMRMLFRAKVESAKPTAVAFDAMTARLGASRMLQHRTGQLLPTSVSPDGQWLALMSALDRDQDLWVMRTDGRDLRRVTDDPWRDWSPRFTPDGQALTFFSNRLGVYQGFRIGVDGSGLVRLTDFGQDAYYTGYAADGRRLFTLSVEAGTRVFEAPWPATLESSKQIGPTQLDGRNVNITAWSPDSRWLSGYLDMPSGETRGHLVIEVAIGKARTLNDDSKRECRRMAPGLAASAVFPARWRARNAGRGHARAAEPPGHASGTR